MIRASGFRKTCHCNVIISENKDSSLIFVNKKPIQSYFNDKKLIELVLSPLKALGINIGFIAKVSGSGTMAQAAAIRYALSIALAKLNNEYTTTLKNNNMFFVDVRHNARKVCGRLKARKVPPCNKR